MNHSPAICLQTLQAGEGQNIPLKGLAIGNGLTDPLEQYKLEAPGVESKGAEGF